MTDTGFERALRDHQQRNTTRPCEAAERGAAMEQAKGFEEWALVELMGHQRIAGRVTEAEIGGCKFIRVDVPAREGEQAMTKFLGPSSIYAITPMSEETCRSVASRISPAPISAWDARRLVEMEDKRKPAELEAGAAKQAESHDEDEDDADDEEISF